MPSNETSPGPGLAAIRVGDRWEGADGVSYVVVSVGGMGVVGYRRDGAAGPDKVTDAVRFVRAFVRRSPPPLRAPPAAAMAKAG